MIIYKDLLTGDEMFTDSSKVRVVDDCIYEVTCRHVTRREGDIQLDGANPSAEGDDGDDGALESSAVSGLDVVLNQRLVETGFTKKDFINYLKTYCKALEKKWQENGMSEDEIKDAKSKVSEAAKRFLKLKLDDIQFFMGESSNPDGMIGLLEYREENGSETPILYFFKQGLEAEKV